MQLPDPDSIIERGKASVTSQVAFSFLLCATLLVGGCGRTSSEVAAAGGAAGSGGESSPATGGSNTGGHQGHEPRDCEGDFSFDDPGVEAQVRAALEYPEGPLGPEVERLMILELTNVASLGGMECLHALTSLWIEGGRVTDLSPLQNLRLARLHIFDLPVADIEPLGSLADLWMLDLYDVPVADLLPLSPLRKLNYLGLMRTQVTSLAGLEGDHLTHLGVMHSPLEDISALAGQEQLMEVGLVNTELTDLSPLLFAPTDPDGCVYLFIDGSPLSEHTLDVGVPQLCDLGWSIRGTPAGGPELQCNCRIRIR